MEPTPIEDRELSPFTGWTRAHWEWLADLMLEGVRPYASPRHAYLNLPGVASSHGPVMDGLEGFSRTFLLAAFRLAGAGGDAPGDLASRYAEGVSAGLDPGSGERWPSIARRSHSIVEAAAIAVSLFESRPWIWDRLSDEARERAAAWLARVRGRWCYRNNWRLFPLVVHAFLRSVGAPHRQEEIDDSLAWLERLYRGSGWYSDGPGHRYDHYCAWALHLYPALWLRMGGDRHEPAAAKLIRERLARYLDDYLHLFGGDGAPLFHGRSLTYRFAAVAPFWAGAITGASTLPAGATRRVASGALRYFVEAGAFERNLLTRGWHDPFPNMVQAYAGPASPYWSSKAFLGLLMPPDHVAWTARELPLPVERGDFTRALWPSGFLVQGTSTDGIVRVASHRSFAPLPLGERVQRIGRGPLVDAHYSKLSYSTRTAPDTVIGGMPEGPDATLSLVDDGWEGRPARLRALGAADVYAGSVQTVRGPLTPSPRRGARIETAVVALGPAELRVHRVVTPAACTVRESGPSVAAASPPESESSDEWALVRCGDLTSLCAGLRGLEPAAAHRGEHVNAFGRHSAAPLLLGRHPGGACVYASLVVLTADRVDPDHVASDVSELRVDGRSVWIACRDGGRLFLQFGRATWVDGELRGRRIRGRVRFARASPDGSSFVLTPDGESRP